MSERQRELVILRVTAVRKAAYNWAEHVPIARRCGLDDEEIARVAYGPDAPFWDPVDAALLRSVDELVADGMVSDETWAVLAEHLDARQLLDLIFTVGAYETIGWMSRSCALVASLDRAATIADRVAIEDLINRYVDAIDAKRWDLLEHVFAEDAVARWNPESSIDGRDAVIDAMRHRLDTDEVVTYQHAASFTPVIHGDTAEANVRIRAMHYGVGPRAGRFYESLGTQVTSFVRMGDGWRCQDYEWQISVRLGSMDVFDG